MRYLVRGAINPLENMNPAKFIIENHTGTNIGNMIFLNSVVKTMMVDEKTRMDFVTIKNHMLSDKYINKVNETYDAFLIPLANAFKFNFYEGLILLTEFVRKLKIPCHIIGVGIQQMLGSKPFEKKYIYNDEVKAFVGAVLEKSPMIGVRGEITGDYLKALGFIPEKDYTVIGCPSMFTYGRQLPQVKEIKSLTPNSVIAFNSKREFETKASVAPFMSFLKGAMDKYPHYKYVMQQIDDVRMLYLDELNSHLRKEKYYDVSKAISFTNIPGWIDYLSKNIDFAFGNRIHGNVAAVLGGVPSLVVPCDKRVLELVDYHKIPSVSLEQLEKEHSLGELYEKTDFSSVHQGHEKRFEHYLEFLHKLGLDTIYDHEYEPGKMPFELAQQREHYHGVVEDYAIINDADKLLRYKDAFRLVKPEM